MAGKSNRVLVSPEGLELLTAAKARLGLSFAAIAERAGVSLGTVQRLFHPERGPEVVGPERAAKITAVLNLALAAGGCTVRGRSRSGLCRSTTSGFEKP
jgi:transcriptional regulator with XRE-family HTH domain